MLTTGIRSEVGINKPDYRKELVDMARGARKGDPDDFLDGLGEKWTETQKSLGS